MGEAAPKPIHLGGKWPKGVSGNPGGRPRTKPFREALSRIIEKMGGPDEAAAALFAKAMTGDVAAFRECADRMDGKVPTPVGGTDELPPIKGFAWIDPTMTGSSASTTSPDNNSSPSTTELSDLPASLPTAEPEKP